MVSFGNKQPVTVAGGQAPAHHLLLPHMSTARRKPQHPTVASLRDADDLDTVSLWVTASGLASDLVKLFGGAGYGCS